MDGRKKKYVICAPVWIYMEIFQFLHSLEQINIPFISLHVIEVNGTARKLFNFTSVKYVFINEAIGESIHLHTLPDEWSQ